MAWHGGRSGCPGIGGRVRGQPGSTSGGQHTASPVRGSGKGGRKQCGCLLGRDCDGGQPRSQWDHRGGPPPSHSRGLPVSEPHVSLCDGIKYLT